MKKITVPSGQLVLLALLMLTSSMLAGCGASSLPAQENAKQDSKPNAAKVTDVKSDAAGKPDIAGKPDTAGTPDTAQKIEQGTLATASTPQPEKPKRDPIYDTEASGKDLIAAAVRKAQRDHKHVLIEWGGNWCGWCYRLHDVFKKNELVSPIVYEEFELVLVDCRTNMELLEHYGGKDQRFSYPHLTVLDAQGQVLTNQHTEPLEEGSGHNPKVVAEFLKKWSPEKIDAEVALTDSLKRATEQNKRVFLQVGTPYCGWCKVLSQFLQDHDTLFAKDFIVLKVDTQRMTNGEQAVARYLPEGNQGVPWFVVLNADGKSIGSSFGPKGNIGYPYAPEETSLFMNLLRESRQTLTDAELDTISTDLNSFREQRERKLSAKKQSE